MKHPIARYRLSLDHAYNDWLELAVEAGWPLALASAALVLAWLWRRWRRANCSGTELGPGGRVGRGIGFFAQ